MVTLSVASLPLASLAQEAYVRAGFGQKAYHNHTTLHPLGLAALVIFGLLVVTLPRRHAILPILLLTALIPTAQRVVVVTLDFSLLRILILAAIGRILIRGEHRSVRLQPVDKLVIAWIGVTFVAWIALRGTPAAAIYRTGLSFDILGLYFVGRCFIREWGDLLAVIRCLAWTSLFLAVMFVIEYTTQKNHFSVFGGASLEVGYRQDKLRCKGPYVHAILAGSYWAVLVPLFGVLLWHRALDRLVAFPAIAACGVIIYCSGSSTPILTVAAGISAAAMFVVRKHMRAIRTTTLAGLTVIHFARAKPVWHLIVYMGVVGGSTAYHRYRLIDAAVRKFPEWFLIGTKSTAHWGFYLFDVTNQYIIEAISGGILGVVLFVMILYKCFMMIGRLWRSVTHNRTLQATAWAVGACLFSYAAMFFSVGIGYAQQNLSLFLITIALIVSLDENRSRRGHRPRVVTAPRRVKRLHYESSLPRTA